MSRPRKSSSRRCSDSADQRDSWSFPAKVSRLHLRLQRLSKAAFSRPRSSTRWCSGQKNSLMLKCAAWSICAPNKAQEATMINPLKMAEMLSQANKMQEEMQRKLEQTVVEGSSGGGAVTATMNGKKELVRIKIDPSAISSLSGPNPDVEMLEALIVGAVNDAGHRA